MPADGSVERIVIGWMKLSYSTPRTMYIDDDCRDQQQELVGQEVWNASAAPWKVVRDARGSADACLGRLDRVDRRAQRRALRPG